MSHRHYPFHLLTTALFSLVVLVIGGSIGGFAYFQQRDMLLAAIEDGFNRSSRETEAMLAAAYLPAQAQIDLLADTLVATPDALNAQAAMARLLKNSPEITEITLIRDGFPDIQATRYPARQAAAPILRLRHASDDGTIVIQARLQLSRLSDTLTRQRMTASTILGILDQHSGELIAIAAKDVEQGKPAAGIPHPLEALLQQPVRGHGVSLDVADRRWRALARSIVVPPEIAVVLLIAVPQDEMLAGADALPRLTVQFTLLLLIVAIPLIAWLSRRMTLSLRQLAALATDVRALRFSDTTPPNSSIREVDALTQAMTQMRGTIRHFLDISSRLSAERHYDQLLDEIVAETMAVADAGAGALYLFDATELLRPMTWKRIGGLAPQSPTDIHPEPGTAVATVIASTQPTQLPLSPIDLPSGLEWLGGWFPGQAVQALLVPLRNRAGDSLGLLLLARGMHTGPYEEELIAFIGALTGTLAITLEKEKLLVERKALLDGVVRMLAAAIDARSPYTSAHCQRVPQLAGMLAEAAATHPRSPFRSMPYDEHAREALHLAAWLHDCGKLFVPDYIADKSVKLETVYNRIHEIRMRFEVLKRDAEIAYWRKIASNGDESVLRRELEATWQTLDAEFSFVAACNDGQRELDTEDIEQLNEIGMRTWMRTLDDRLGIPEEEARRKSTVPPRQLPAPEHLLADRLEHLIDLAGDFMSGKTQAAHARLPRPRHRLNLGELYCLSVRRGTLTPEERYLINSHVLGTISMLSTLPFPAELASVPETAAGHHERPDGSGYPYGKVAEELSLAARILAIADIYEALTASDRPYKSGKPASEALAIMEEMARRGHLDADLLKLFIDSDIPTRYTAAGLQTLACTSSDTTGTRRRRPHFAG